MRRSADKMRSRRKERFALGCAVFDWDLLIWRDVAMSNNNDRGSPIGLIVSITNSMQAIISKNEAFCNRSVVSSGGRPESGNALI
jgi:hypothetical protein